MFGFEPDPDWRSDRFVCRRCATEVVIGGEAKMSREVAEQVQRLCTAHWREKFKEIFHAD